MPYISLDRASANAAPATTVADPRANNGLTLAQLQEELQALLIDRTDVGAPRRQLYINLAYTDMVTSLHIPEMKSSIEIPLEAGQSLYLLPEAVFAFIELSLTHADTAKLESGGPLEMTDLRAFRGRPLKEGSPTEAFRHGDMLVVWPTPEEADTLVADFWIRPVWLTDDAHCPILGVEWHEGLLWNARHKLLSGLQEWEAAIPAENAYVSFIRKRLDPDAVEASTKVPRSSVPQREEMLRRRKLPWRDS